jgi:hypothetical protein
MISVFLDPSLKEVILFYAKIYLPVAGARAVATCRLDNRRPLGA